MKKSKLKPFEHRNLTKAEMEEFYLYTDYDVSNSMEFGEFSDFIDLIGIGISSPNLKAIWRILD